MEDGLFRKLLVVDFRVIITMIKIICNEIKATFNKKVPKYVPKYVHSQILKNIILMHVAECALLAVTYTTGLIGYYCNIFLAVLLDCFIASYNT